MLKMRNIIAIAIILISIFGLTFVTVRTYLEERDVQNTEIDQSFETLPSFDSYIVDGDTYIGKIADIVVLEGSFAESIYDLLVEGLSINRVNFANNYSVVSIACGEKCQSSFIIDVRDGNIVEHGILSSELGIAYSKDSRLFVVNPQGETSVNTDERSTSTVPTVFYFLDEQGIFRHILKYIPGQTHRSECSPVTVTAKNPFTKEIRLFSDTCSVPYGWEPAYQSMERAVDNIRS